MWKNWPLLTLLVMALVLGSSCSDFKKPELRGVENIQSPKLGTRQSVLSFDLRCYNPNKSRFRVKHATGEAWVEGQKFGDFRIDSSILVPGRSEFTIPVIIDLDMKNALKNSAVLLLKDEVEVKIEGKARLGKSGFYFNYPILFEGKQSVSQYIKK